MAESKKANPTINLIDKFNAKTFRAYNKGMEDGELVCKMLVNYKWSVKHLRALGENYAENAIAQFNALCTEKGVVLEKPAEKKAEKAETKTK